MPRTEIVRVSNATIYNPNGDRLGGISHTFVTIAGVRHFLMRTPKAGAHAFREWLTIWLGAAGGASEAPAVKDESRPSAPKATSGEPEGGALVPALRVDQNGTVVASSYDVAKTFGKAHKDVLESIRAIERKLPPNDAHWFQAVKRSVKVGFGIREDDAYDMTRDGLSLLVMGYETDKAFKFKIAYIHEFNRMEAALREQATAVPSLDFINANMAALEERIMERLDKTERFLEALGKATLAAPKSAPVEVTHARPSHFLRTSPAPTRPSSRRRKPVSPPRWRPLRLGRESDQASPKIHSIALLRGASGSAETLATARLKVQDGVVVKGHLLRS